ncbi:hypothetical protein Dimus_031345 [Dionaea muscipula]
MRPCLNQFLSIFRFSFLLVFGVINALQNMEELKNAIYSCWISHDLMNCGNSRWICCIIRLFSIYFAIVLDAIESAAPNAMFSGNESITVSNATSGREIFDS